MLKLVQDHVLHLGFPPGSRIAVDASMVAAALGPDRLQLLKVYKFADGGKCYGIVVGVHGTEVLVVFDLKKGGPKVVDPIPRQHAKLVKEDEDTVSNRQVEVEVEKVKRPATVVYTTAKATQVRVVYAHDKLHVTENLNVGKVSRSNTKKP